MDLLLFVLILVGMIALTMLGSMAVSAAENSRIAKHTGVDPRPNRPARKPSSSAPTIT